MTRRTKGGFSQREDQRRQRREIAQQQREGGRDRSGG
jgi:hypothetical protein